LATTEIRKVPVTILSRCQRFDLVRVPVETLKKHFAWIAEQEKVELSDAANELLARAADGSVRDGLSLLDQAIAQTGGHVDESAVMDMLKRADRGVVVDFMQTILSGNVSAALARADEIYTNGADLSMLLTDMMEWTHWATRMHPVLRANVGDSIPYTADQRERINEINKHVSLNTLSRLWQVMVASVGEMAAAAKQKQCFDMLVIRLMHIADMPSVPEILKQNADTAHHAAPAAPAPAPTPNAPKTIEIKSAAELADALSAAREMMLYSYFTKNIEVTGLSDHKISYFDRGNDSEFQQKLVLWLNTKTGAKWELNKIEESHQNKTVREQIRTEAESDPMVADAMSLFEGAEIVGISKQ
jgi:DNA polymerase-3 subunit gamma/tau